MCSTCSGDPQETETTKTSLVYGYDDILYAKDTPVFHLYPIDAQYRA